MEISAVSRSPSPRQGAFARRRATPSGVFLAAAMAADPGRVVAGARRLHAGGQVSRALSLLEAATAHRPEDESLWVARLEILSAASLRTEFLRVVREFVDRNPDSPRFAEIVGLWKRLSPA